MKKLIYFLGLILSISLVACNNDDVPNDQQASEVQISVNTHVSSGTTSDDFTKAADQTYDRNGAPAYVSGITITVENNKLDWYPDVTEEFPFEDVGGTDGDNPITMTIGVGYNDFTAVGTPTNSALTTSVVDYMDKDASSTLDAKAAIYSAAILTSYPIYMEYATNEPAKYNVNFNTNWFDALSADDPYTGTVGDGLTLQQIKEYERPAGTLKYWSSGYFDVWPGYVDLELSTQVGRTAIVFESETDIYIRVSPVLYDDNDTPDDESDDTVVDNTQQFTHTNTAKASIALFNGANMTDGTYIKNTFQISADQGSTWEDVAATVIVDTQVGKNVTHLINYNGSDQVNQGFASDVVEFTEDTSNNNREIL